mmetsp:Transcript_42811/g.118283  ORF Transcript_42811/g.118283 Transcript_42811/m.118283 type:complete len:284 (+) Transcript_42811:543-1394(+)
MQRPIVRAADHVPLLPVDVGHGCGPFVAIEGAHASGSLQIPDTYPRVCVARGDAAIMFETRTADRDAGSFMGLEGFLDEQSRGIPNTDHTLPAPSDSALVLEVRVDGEPWPVLPGEERLLHLAGLEVPQDEGAIQRACDYLLRLGVHRGTTQRTFVLTRKRAATLEVRQVPNLCRPICRASQTDPPAHFDAPVHRVPGDPELALVEIGIHRLLHHFLRLPRGLCSRLSCLHHECALLLQLFVELLRLRRQVLLGALAKLRTERNEQVRLRRGGLAKKLCTEST